MHACQQPRQARGGAWHSLPPSAARYRHRFLLDGWRSALSHFNSVAASGRIVCCADGSVANPFPFPLHTTLLCDTLTMSSSACLAQKAPSCGFGATVRRRGLGAPVAATALVMFVYVDHVGCRVFSTELRRSAGLVIRRALAASTAMATPPLLADVDHPNPGVSSTEFRLPADLCHTRGVMHPLPPHFWRSQLSSCLSPRAEHRLPPSYRCFHTTQP